MPPSLTIHLQNRSSSAQVYAYVTGLALQHDSARVLLKANGHDVYFPSHPPAILSPLAEDCAIALGPPGSTIAVHVPQLAGGRIWFSRDDHLTFLLNPGATGTGPALVEPSVLNPTDANAGVDFAFAEFTLDNDQLFANISYVDFVPALPIALSLRTAGGAVQHVSGMAPDGLERVCQGLRRQAQRDGRPWDRLVVSRPDGSGRPLRALNPTHGNAVGAGFDGYYEPFVDEVWRRYHPSHGRAVLRVNTQAGPGVVSGWVDERDRLVIAGEPFPKPSTPDIFACNTGPFTTGPSPLRNAVIPRLAAAFLRTALLQTEEHPSHPGTFYAREPTNHYARLVHEVNLDGKGYAFAYDDVQPDGGHDQSGKVNAGDPAVFVVSVGGGGAYVGDRMPDPGAGVGVPAPGGQPPPVGPRPDVGGLPGQGTGPPPVPQRPREHPSQPWGRAGGGGQPAHPHLAELEKTAKKWFGL